MSQGSVKSPDCMLPLGEHPLFRALLLLHPHRGGMDPYLGGPGLWTSGCAPCTLMFGSCPSISLFASRPALASLVPALQAVIEDEAEHEAGLARVERIASCAKLKLGMLQRATFSLCIWSCIGQAEGAAQRPERQEASFQVQGVASDWHLGHFGTFEFLVIWPSQGRGLALRGPSRRRGRDFD